MKIGRLTIEFHISWEGSYMKKVKAALKNGEKLNAIKIYKDATGMGLRDAKDAVDALCPKYLKRYEVMDQLAKFQAEQFNK